MKHEIVDSTFHNHLFELINTLWAANFVTIIRACQRISTKSSPILIAPAPYEAIEEV